MLYFAAEGMKTTPLPIKWTGKLRTTQRAIDRMILEISLIDHITNIENSDSDSQDGRNHDQTTKYIYEVLKYPINVGWTILNTRLVEVGIR